MFSSIALAALAAAQAVPATSSQEPASPAVAEQATPVQGAAQVAPPTDPTTTPLSLTCVGSGTANKYKSGLLGTHKILIGQDRQFEDQVDVRLFNGDDRIRLPRSMVPGIHGGSEGWFRLTEVKADARSIHGEAELNFMSHPKIYIDRVTGTISISGKAGDYSGQCQAVQADAPAKF